MCVFVLFFQPAASRLEIRLYTSRFVIKQCKKLKKNFEKVKLNSYVFLRQNCRSRTISFVISSIFVRFQCLRKHTKSTVQVFLHYDFLRKLLTRNIERPMSFFLQLFIPFLFSLEVWNLKTYFILVPTS